MQVDNDDTLTAQIEAEFEKEKAAKNLGGRPKKKYKDLTSTSAKHDRLRPILDTCLHFCESEEISFDAFLGELGKYYYNSVGDDFKKAKIFTTIANGDDPFEKHTMSVPRSLAFKDFARLGQKPYDDIKKLLDPVLKLGRLIDMVFFSSNDLFFFSK